jgi:TPR repeat protein
MASRSVLPLIRQARAGDATSQFELGKLYLDGGQGLGANQHCALLWLDRSAEQGYAAAWRLIGQRVSPAVVDKAYNSQNLIRWYELAANDGCASAQTKLAQLLLSNKYRYTGDAANRADAAMQLLRCAAAKGEATARLELGICLLRERRGEGAKTHQAVELLEQAYAAGKGAAARQLAEHYWQVGNAELAYRWYTRCIDLQDVELCYRFGMLRVLLGEPGGKFLELAAAASHPLACEELGLRYAIGWCRDSDGALTSRSLKKSVRWLERAASQGSAKACFFLALLYNHRHCSFRSHGKAREWLFEAARRGHREAQYRAGVRLLRDLVYARAPDPQETGLEDPDVAAIRLLVEAKRQGHVQAASVLDAAACRAPRLSEAQAARWAQAIAAMTPLSVPLAMRLELASVFGLRVCEMTMINPVQAHRGDCFVVDLRETGFRLRRRIVLIEHPAQRDAADKASSLFRRSTPLPEDLHGGYESRYQMLVRRCAKAGIDLRQLGKRTPDVIYPSLACNGLAEDETEVVPSSFPSRRLSAVGSIEHFTARLSEM